jgi:hypothetical protein
MTTPHRQRVSRSSRFTRCPTAHSRPAHGAGDVARAVAHPLSETSLENEPPKRWPRLEPQLRRRTTWSHATSPTGSPTRRGGMIFTKRCDAATDKPRRARSSSTCPASSTWRSQTSEAGTVTPSLVRSRITVIVSRRAGESQNIHRRLEAVRKIHRVENRPGVVGCQALPV